MKTVNTKTELQDQISLWKNAGYKIGFVPTMGALHDGHLSLVDLAQSKSDKVIVSIFVNPTQFAPHEDFDSYPRDVQGDAAILQKNGVDLLYTPDETEIYPDGKNANIRAGRAAHGLESDFRPHFFDGVVNVVSRLFDHVRPDIAVFGEKDFQQLMVIREMVEKLGQKIDIIGGPIKRDRAGLALSSRNAYLSADELEIARQLNKILELCHDTDKARNAILNAGFDKVDYVEKRWNRILAATWIGKTRLIDNMAL